MEKEAGLTYNEYRISKANQPQDAFVKKGFFKIEYFTKRFKANQSSRQSSSTGLRACGGEKEAGTKRSA
jgi:hypothetical protein